MEIENNRKGKQVVEPGIAINEFVEKIKKLAYQDFDNEEVIKFLKKNKLPFEFLEPYIFFSDTRYTRNLIHKTPDFEVLVFCWRPGQHTPINHYQNSRGWLIIEKGKLQIEKYREKESQKMALVKKIESAVIEQESVKSLIDIYSLENKSNTDSVSLHIYAPMIEEITIYDEKKINDKKETKLDYHSIHGKLVSLE
jgi:cysteine dioxygenase